jgi:hypothetical protein
MSHALLASLPSIRGVAMSLGKLVEWDGKIPVWGLLLLGLGQVAYGYNALADLDKRLTLREASAAQGRLELQRLALQQQALAGLEGQLNTMKELLVRIERRLDRDK